MRVWLTAGVIVVSLVATGRAQSPGKVRTRSEVPDLQGIWSNATLTPLERPADQKDKEFLTEEEAAEFERTGLDRTLKPLAIEVKLSGELNATWLELGKIVRSRRTSLVIDPPDGKVPYTDAGKKRRDMALARVFNLVPVNSWEDRSLAERCLMTGGLLTPNPFYLNNHQFIQNRNYIVVLSEVMNETRIIPLDERPQLSAAITRWGGESRGHWEGDALVVETGNFDSRAGILGGTDKLRLVERFTKIDNDTMDYKVTVTDPDSFTRAWTLQNTMRRMKKPIYSYSCHEGNYGLRNILSGARAMDKARAEKEGK